MRTSALVQMRAIFPTPFSLSLALSRSLSPSLAPSTFSTYGSPYVLDAGALFDKLLDFLDLHVHFDEDDPVAVGACW